MLLPGVYPQIKASVTKLLSLALRGWLKETNNYSTSDKRVITRHHDDVGAGNWHLYSLVSRERGWKACWKQLPILSSLQWKFKTHAHIIFISWIPGLWASQSMWIDCCPFNLISRHVGCICWNSYVHRALNVTNLFNAKLRTSKVHFLDFANSFLTLCLLPSRNVFSNINK